MIPRFAPLLATLFLATPALAQETVHLRGEILSIEDSTISIETTGAQTYDVEMAENFMVMVYRQIAPEDVGPGDFLSIPSRQEDGEKVAISINVFPETMRGTGEGERAWDLTEDSLMTNATVGEVESASDGRVLNVEYDGTEERVIVPEGTPITSFGPDPDRQLQAGDQAILFVQQAEDGTPTANLAGVSADGSLPPV
ncbi:hypothetical protein [Palleronia abyssalis]|uniref:DUF5666 domain-containing protein n=1 Tax=Palleronia abyssalis TaxID=1501240 RepID=A0A2R8BXA7_9RHOB|nr:hypothetical protein [Palleronia abyssalis]SPJ24791.1 hypothetical protein PAA8504_02629 [Palleronia abyssalis]